jgi:hypothetical protein
MMVSDGSYLRRMDRQKSNHASQAVEMESILTIPRSIALRMSFPVIKDSLVLN